MSDSKCDNSGRINLIDNSNSILLEERCDEDIESNDDINKIHDIVIKEMDLGYLVKVGCKSLCLESKERLIELFTSYVNNPNDIMNKFFNNTLFDDKTETRIGIIGKSKDDVHDYLKTSAILAFKDFRKTDGRYEGVFNDELIVLFPLTTPEHCMGMKFDKIIETHGARENKKFEEIIKHSNINIT